MKEPNFAPVYCALYPELAAITRRHGYALAIHGTLGRDMDLVCVPWSDTPADPQVVVDDIVSAFSIEQVGEPVQKAHRRMVWTISVGFGECFLDLSFMPRVVMS